MRAALIVNNTITNIIEAESLASIEHLFAEAIDADTLPASVGIGWTRDGENWLAPVAPQVKARLDTPLFMMRFAAHERVALRQAATDDTPQAPYLADLLEILMDARLAYVEFDDPELVASMTMLVQLGLLTQARADAIMTP